MDVIVVIILWLIILYQAVEKFLDREARIRREEELMNRIMARNYQEYIRFEPQKDMQVVKVEDLLKEQEEKGVPVY